VAALPPLPLLGWGGEWKEKRQKLVGRDKGSLTEQQIKGTGTTTTVLIRRIHETNSRMHRTSLTARCRTHSRAAAPPHRKPA